MRKKFATWTSRKKSKIYLRLRFNSGSVYNFFIKYDSRIGYFVLFVAFIASFLIENHFNNEIEQILQKTRSLKSIMSSVGSALIGASAIAFSLIMFSLQINIERMPHGMFFRFSRDIKIVGFFVLSIIFALAVCILPMWIDIYARQSIPLLLATWCFLGAFLSIFLAYRRSLFLVNPIRQLSVMFSDVSRDFRRSSHFANVAAPLLDQGDGDANAGSDTSNFDSARMTYFQVNQHWARLGEQAISHAISYAQRYSEARDYPVAKTSLDIIVAINSEYVRAKGRTFFSHTLMLDNPLVTDNFINQTLEQLRQSFQVCRARGDETAIEQIFATFEGLFYQYAQIKYPSEHDELAHANLATGYLCNAVESTIASDSPDVLMIALRRLGNCAAYLAQVKRSASCVYLVNRIMAIGVTGVVKKDHMPVSSIAVEQATRLTLVLFYSKEHSIDFAVRRIRTEVFDFAKRVIPLPDTPLQMNHATYLGSYFSSTKTESLKQSLIAIVNQLARDEIEKEDAAHIIENIEEWADGIYQPCKDLLLLSIENRAHFTFDISHWITDVSEILLALANNDACPDHAKEKLQNHATWLVATLSWIKKDKETIAFLGNYQWGEQIFSAACAGRSRRCHEYEKQAFDLLLQWAGVGGRYQTGWGILEEALFGLAALAAGEQGVLGGERLIKEGISKWKDEPDPIEQEIRASAARTIRERAQMLPRGGHWSRRIDLAMSELPVETIQPLLMEIADLLSPETKGEKVRSYLF